MKNLTGNFLRFQKRNVYNFFINHFLIKNHETENYKNPICKSPEK